MKDEKSFFEFSFTDHDIKNDGQSKPQKYDTCLKDGLHKYMFAN